MPQDFYRNQARSGWIGGVDAGPLRLAPLDIDINRRFVWSFNDFTCAEDYTAGGVPWTETDIAVSGGSITLGATTATAGIATSILLIDAGVTTQRGFQTQMTAAALSELRGLRINGATTGNNGTGIGAVWGWGCRFKVNTASAGHMYAGLSFTDTSLQAPATGLPAPVAGQPAFCFFSTAASLGCFSNRANSQSQTSTGLATLVDDTFIEVAFQSVQLSTFVAGGTTQDTTDGYMDFYINVSNAGWKKVATHNGFIGQSAAVLPSFGCINGAGAIDLSVDYFWQYAPRFTI